MAFTKKSLNAIIFIVFSSSRTGKAAGCFHFEGKRKER